MLSIAHTLVSLPFAFYLENPLLIFLAALVGHLITDTILHWNIYPEKFPAYPYALVAFDVIGGVIVAWLLLNDTFFTLPVLLAIAGGNAPDIAHGLWDLIGKTRQNKYLSWAKPLFVFHNDIQLETKHPLPGLIPQIIFVLLALIAIL